MVIDIILVVLIILAVIKGYQRGLIVGIFSFIAIIIGLAAAIKLSVVAAQYIGGAVNVSDKWLPVISFLVVFLIVVLLIRLGANLIQKTAEAMSLGFLNRLGGILLYAVIFIIVYSIILFYAEQIKLIQPDTIQSSVTYPFIEPWGPKVIDGLASVIPFFKDMFNQLQDFFGRISENAIKK
jgi:membrane protein required for colicin V production